MKIFCQLKATNECESQLNEVTIFCHTPNTITLGAEILPLLLETVSLMGLLLEPLLKAGALVTCFTLHEVAYKSQTNISNPVYCFNGCVHFRTKLNFAFQCIMKT